MNNTVTRSLSGIVFLAVVLGGLLLNQYLFAALLVFMVVTMLHEFYRMTMGDKYPRSQRLAICLGVCMFALMFCVSAFGIPIKYAALNLLLLIAIMVTSLFVRDKEDFGLFAYLYTGLLYIAVPLAFSNLVVFRNGTFSGLLMVGFFCIIWASDVGAYCFGLLLGKNGKKLCPSISPKKSWAGFWGGLLLAAVAGVVLQLTGVFRFPMVHAVVLAVVMSVIGVFGDLFESQWKRLFGVKDSGNIIPGHGGMLDRFDSALFAIPAGVIYLVLFGLI